MSFELPTLAVIVPLLGALLVGAVPRSEPALARGLGLAVALVELVVLAVLVAGYDPAGPAVQQRVHQPWLPGYAVAWSLGVDGRALAYLVLVALVFPLGLMVGGRPRPGEPPLIVGLLGLQAAWVAVLLARDLLTLATAWELAAVVTAILLGERGDGRMGVPGRTAAARRYAGHALVGSAALLAAMVVLGVAYSHASEGSWSWQLDDLSRVTLPPATEALGFALVIVAIATALPLVPLQGWLAPAGVSGPTPVVAVLFGAGLPMGLFLLAQLALPLFPRVAGEWAEPLAAVAVVGAVYAALACWGEREPGRLLAHAALLHLALAVVATLSGGAAARLATGPYLIAHALALVLLTAVFHALRRSQIGNLGELAGWARAAPRSFAFAFAATLVLAGLPGTAGFVGGLGLVTGAVAGDDLVLTRTGTWIAIAGVAGVLGYIGVLRSLWHAGRGSPRPGLRERLGPLGLRETCVGAAALALAAVFGVAPAALLERAAGAELAAHDAAALARCLTIEARNRARPERHAALRERDPNLCSDPEGRIRQFYGRDTGEGEP